jgi:hypothetical protein
VSLLSIVSKIAERCVYDKIYPLICDKLCIHQHGFLKGKSTCTQLVDFTNALSSVLDKGGQTDVIYTDFSKAFDTVSHNMLLTKLKKFGFCGNLFNWFQSYLSTRLQAVVISGATSTWLPVTSGVPQGSILGPLLFLLYINDLPDVIKNSKIALFADDVKMYSEVININDCHNLQDDINSLCAWSVTWGMRLNVSKCKVLSVSRKKNTVIFNYAINSEQLERLDVMRDLGVIIDNKLSWNDHVTTILAKAKRVMGLIKRSIGYKAPVSVKRTLYLTLARSIVDSGTQVWGGLSKTNSIKIEKLQRSATRYILDFPSINYKERLLKLNLLPLTYRRDLSDVCLFFKSLNSQCALNVNNYVQFTSDLKRNTRSSVIPTNICVPGCKTDAHKKMFFNRISKLWNSISPQIRVLRDFSVFKSNVFASFKKHFVDNFDCDNFSTWHFN